MFMAFRFSDDCKSKFLLIYKTVFDTDGNVKLCGRQRCKNLIHYANSIKQGDYGNEDTGFMNVPNIIMLHKELLS